MNNKKRISFLVPNYVYKTIRDMSKSKNTSIKNTIKKVCVKVSKDTIIKKSEDCKLIRIDFKTDDIDFIRYIASVSRQLNIRMNDLLKFCCIIFVDNVNSKILETKSDNTSISIFKDLTE